MGQGVPGRLGAVVQQKERVDSGGRLGAGHRRAVRGIEKDAVLPGQIRRQQVLKHVRLAAFSFFPPARQKRQSRVQSQPSRRPGRLLDNQRIALPIL